MLIIIRYVHIINYNFFFLKLNTLSCHTQPKKSSLLPENISDELTETEKAIEEQKCSLH